MTTKPKRDLTPWVIGFIIFYLMVCVWQQATSNVPPPPPSQDDIKLKLAYECQDAIMAKLKSPASAKFGELYEPGNGFMKNGNRWMITGFVDSQNSFGAMLRMNYGCVFQEMTPGNFTLLKANQI